MERPKLQAVARAKSGTNSSRALRKSGILPAIIYGEEVPNGAMEISLNDHDFTRAIAQNSADGLFDLEIGDQVYTIHISEIQKHPVKRTHYHVDFHQIEMNVVQTFRVPMNYIGSPIGLKDGGYLDIQNHHIEINCLPNDLPSQIDLDISHQDVGDVLYAKDLVLPEGSTLESDEMLVLTTVRAVLEEEDEEGEEGEEKEEIHEPQVIGEKKETKE